MCSEWMRLSRASSVSVCVSGWICWAHVGTIGSSRSGGRAPVSAGGIRSAQYGWCRCWWWCWIISTCSRLPGRERGAFSVATTSTGCRAWWTCRYSPTPACEASRGTAWAPAAGWSSVCRAEGHRCSSAATLRGGRGAQEEEGGAFWFQLDTFWCS